MPIEPDRAAFRFLALGLLLITGALLVTACGQRSAEPAATTGGFVPDTKPAPPVRWVDATVAAGTRIELTLVPVGAAGGPRKGEVVQARVALAILAGPLLAIPEGSVVQGIVTAAEPGRPPLIDFKVVSTPTGASAAIVAHQVPELAQRSIVPGGPEGGTPIAVVLDQPLQIKVRQ